MSQPHYVPLHVHTEFSLLDGAMRLKEYIAFAKEQGWKAVAITDHGNVFGAVKFFQLAEKAGIKPILGVEQYFVPDVLAPNSVEKKYYHVTIIVKNQVGYQNLCRLMSFAYKKGFYFKPRVDFRALEENSEGLILLSGCLGGLISQHLLENNVIEAEKAAQRFISIVGKENFFLEVMPADHATEQGAAEQKMVNKRIFALAEKLGVKVVATGDSHYLLPSHNFAHEVMLAVGTKNLLTDSNRFSFKDFKGHLKTTEEMLAAFPGKEEAVWTSGQIADLCDFKFKFGELFFPQYNIPEGFTQETYFEKLCKDGLERLFLQEIVPASDRAKYEARLVEEIALISKMGFIGYFLVVGDFIAWAKANDIPVGPGRGSAAGSLVAWALQITNIDPVKYNLLFERFLNPERVSMPDVDIDFCIFGRELVINYVKQKYGYDCVCQIITFGTMAAKGVVKDVARVLGFSFADSQAITDLISDQLKITLKDAVKQEPLLAKMIEDNPKVKELFDVCFVLEGVTRHASKHAAGVVISPKPLEDVVPLYIPPKTTDLVTQYAMTELEAVGFLKMDFLGLKNLTVIDRTVRAVEKRYGVKINLDKIPMDDQATFKTLSLGKTAGVFQFEGSGVTEVLVKLQPDKFEDLIAVNALYRPGPLGSGMVDDFIDGRHGKKESQYMFPELEPVLSETYGVIVYQEQVMKVASVIAGYSLGGADILRRAMGKKKPEEMAKQKTIFVEGAQRLGFDTEKAEKLFDLMAYFAGYGFNKSHSAAYALIAYHTAYLKTHYPKEFIAATLSFETSDPDKLTEYLQKAKEMNVKVMPPSVNRSEAEFVAIDEGVLFGLSGVKGLGEACLNEILEQRNQKPFTSLLDFCKRVNLRTANKRVLENLIYSGAMDDLAGNRAQKLAKLDKIIELVHLEKEKAGQVGLFASSMVTSSVNGSSDLQDIVFDALEELPLAERLDKEKETLGFYLSSHPLEACRPEIALFEAGGYMFQDPGQSVGKKICVLGLIVACKAISTKTGKNMAFVMIEDVYKNRIEIVAFSALYEKCSLFLQVGATIFVTGVLEQAAELLKIKAEKVLSYNDLFNTKVSGYGIRLYLRPLTEQDEHLIKQLAASLGDGNSDIRIMYAENHANIQLLYGKKVLLSNILDKRFLFEIGLIQKIEAFE